MENLIKNQTKFAQADVPVKVEPVKPDTAKVPLAPPNAKPTENTSTGTVQETNHYYKTVTDNPVESVAVIALLGAVAILVARFFWI